MKKLLLFLALAAFCVSATAQDTPKKPSFSGFVSNKFWDNWEISIGGGMGTALSTGTNYGSFGDRLGFEANFSVAKWLHPVVGMRLQLQGGQFANFDSALTKTKWPYLFAHADVMINFSNWVGGYREDRAYYLIPFAGFGYIATNFTDSSQNDTGMGMLHNYAFSSGLLNKFRISRSFDFNIELKWMLTPAKTAPVQFDDSYLFGFSATAGFTYRFNKRDFERGVPGFTADDIRAYQEAIAAGAEALAVSEVEMARLANELNASRAETAAAKRAAADAAEAAKRAAAQKKAEKVEPAIILFDYSQAVISDKEKTRLQMVANEIKSGSKDQTYKIVGHADQATGTASGNKKVAEHRAKNVYDYLISLGVNAKQLTYEGKGNDKDVFEVQKANRAALID